MHCRFCQIDHEARKTNGHAFAASDGHPVSEGHTLIIPKRHVPTIFDLTSEEYHACFDLVRTVCAELAQRLKTEAFNIGVNSGKAAGQSINHAHIHIIPRYEGDVENPQGGVRHVIPGKGYY